MAEPEEKTKAAAEADAKPKADKPKAETKDPKPEKAQADAKPKADKPSLFVDDTPSNVLLPAVGIATIRPRNEKQVGYFVLGRPCSHAKPLRINCAALTDEQRRDLPLDRCIEITVEG